MLNTYQAAFERALDYAISAAGSEALKNTSVFASNECSKRSAKQIILKQAA